MISVILIEPENEGNVGAVARVMKNFGFFNLVLINPKAEITENTRCRAKHAQDVIDNIKIKDDSYLDTFDVLVATTARLGSEYNINRVPLSPEELSSKINEELNVGIVFGRESDGLTNEELAKCNLAVSIPAYGDYPTLNLSHAVGIILYELYRAHNNESFSNLNLASKEYLKTVDEKFTGLLDRLNFDTEDKKETQVKAWKRIMSKAALTEREAFILFGLFKKINNKLDGKNF